VKLVVPETETEALLSRLGAGEGLASSVLAAIEVPRAARRASDDPEVHARAGQVVAAIDLLSLGPEVRELAARLAPIALRSLEAVHLASALAVADHVTAFVAYDERLAEAAADAGLDVIAPGARVR